jgi:CO/xanthine dehydrogenase Mo-binding subunit
MGSVAEESDFHRRYAANELVRKRRIQLPRNSKALKGIGCSVAEQISGMTGERELGAVTIRLDPGGNARLFCSLPTPTQRLTTAWRQLVAQELGLEIDAVSIDTAYSTDPFDSGPRLFSRGSSVVPRAIQSICQTIQKQRFREPLPIQVRRTIRTSRAARTPAHALRSAGAAVVEAVLLPASMEIDIKSVTLCVYAGRIMDRGAAEAELRRGIYQALNWTLHEAVTDSADIGHYRTNFRGKPPRIRIVFGAAERRDGPTGIGELPFLTVPAALTSAISQASGLYLDTLPVRPATLLQMLQEE